MPTRFTPSDLRDKGLTRQKDGSYAKTPVKVEKVAQIKRIEAQGASKSGSFVFDVTPMGKPSFQKSDKWRTKDHPNPRMRQRPEVGRWIETKKKMQKEAQKQGFVFPESGAFVIFKLPMPPSWSKKKKEQMNNTPHKQRPDLDNLMKFLGDSVCEEDSYIFQCSLAKYWGYEGNIIISI